MCEEFLVFCHRSVLPAQHVNCRDLQPVSWIRRRKSKALPLVNPPMIHARFPPFSRSLQSEERTRARFPESAAGNWAYRIDQNMSCGVQSNGWLSLSTEVRPGEFLPETTRHTRLLSCAAEAARPGQRSTSVSISPHSVGQRSSRLTSLPLVSGHRHWSNSG